MFLTLKDTSFCTVLLLLSLLFNYKAHADTLTFSSSFPSADRGESVIQGDYVLTPTSQYGSLIWLSNNGGCLFSSATTVVFRRLDGGYFTFDSCQHDAGGSSTVTWTGYQGNDSITYDTFGNIIGDDFLITRTSIRLANVPINKLVLTWTGSGVPYTDNISLTTTPTPDPLDFTYSIKTDNTVALMGYTGNDDEVIIPDAIYDKPVTSIATDAFNGKTGLKRISIPASVTSIGDQAFLGCSNLSEISIPTNTTYLGDAVFRGCSSLVNVVIPENVGNISYELFRDYHNITNILILGAPSSFEQRAFYGCDRLSEINIPVSVSSIGTYSFYNCTSLTNISLPNDVTIESSAFYYCEGLTNLEIPRGTKIKNHAFQGCHSLFTVEIPDSINEIGQGAFSDCSSLTNYLVDGNNTHYSSIDGVLFNKTKDVLLGYPNGRSGQYIIPDRVSQIGDYAFAYCRNLEGIIFPTTISRIGASAFAFCSNLTRIVIPDSVTYFDYSAFRDCTNLREVRLPSGLTSIRNALFLNCTSLTSISIPEGVTSFESLAFSGCSQLTTIYCNGSPPSTGYHALHTLHPSATVYYPEGVSGWGTTLGGISTALWNPTITTSDTTFGMYTNGFGFMIIGSNDFGVVVETCTNLFDGWHPISTNILGGGSSLYIDNQATNLPSRFYRLRMP